MRCPFCGYPDTRVLESRTIENGMVVRRRRECPKCGARFTTYERWEVGPSWVIKKDGRREKFSREKILKGIMKACEKRPISYEDMEKAVDDIVLELQRFGGKEVESKIIGELVMKKLKEMDQVAYVRFASVYKDFREIDQFIDIIHKLKGGRSDEKQGDEEGKADQGRIRKAQERTRGAQEEAHVRGFGEDKGGEGAR